MDTMVSARPKIARKSADYVRPRPDDGEALGIPWCMTMAKDDDNFDIIDQIHALHPEWELPCQMTVAELRAEAEQSVLDAQNGWGISIEEARALHPRI
jgi:hypothetical protein